MTWHRLPRLLRSALEFRLSLKYWWLEVSFYSHSINEVRFRHFLFVQERNGAPWRKRLGRSWPPARCAPLRWPRRPQWPPYDTAALYTHSRPQRLWAQRCAALCLLRPTPRSLHHSQTAGFPENDKEKSTGTRYNQK